MTVLPTASGFDGTKSYPAGEPLETNAQHALMLFQHGLAEPIDDEATGVAEIAKGIAAGTGEGAAVIKASPTQGGKNAG
jgi:hypothetical protein